MELSQELKDKIIKVLGDFPELKEQTLNGELEAIRTIGQISRHGLTAEEIVNMYETGKEKEIYIKAKKLLEMNQLYNDLCNLYYETQSKTSSK